MSSSAEEARSLGFLTVADRVVMNRDHLLHEAKQEVLVLDADVYTPPVWPSRPGEQIMMGHLEIRVDDLEAACAHARACGATLADFQPQADVRVHFDPDGHPFCLYLET